MIQDVLTYIVLILAIGFVIYRLVFKKKTKEHKCTSSNCDNTCCSGCSMQNICKD